MQGSVFLTMGSGVKGCSIYLLGELHHCIHLLVEPSPAAAETVILWGCQDACANSYIGRYA
jgi:hypothetical protein